MAKQLERDIVLQKRAMELLEKHSLTPIDIKQWKKPIWHSSHGVCKTDKEKLVFVKIFPFDLKENAESEVEKQLYFKSLGIKEIVPPEILFYDRDDLMVVMDVINNPSLDKLSDKDLDSALKLLSEGLLGIRKRTISTDKVPIMITATQKKEAEDMSPSQWALRDAIKWRENIPEELSDIRKRTQGIIDKLGGGLMETSVWAFGDATPRHFFYGGNILTYIDFELARRRADSYDIAYFCHRSLTRGEITPWNNALNKLRLLISNYVNSLTEDDNERQRMLRQINTLFGLRVIGGFNDIFAFNVGKNLGPHTKALEVWESERLIN